MDYPLAEKVRNIGLLVLLLFLFGKPLQLLSQNLKEIALIKLDSAQIVSAQYICSGFVEIRQGKGRQSTVSHQAEINGEGLIPVDYSVASDIRDNQVVAIRVEKNTASGLRYGFADKMGKLIVPIEYDKLQSKFSDGWAAGEKDSLCWLLDTLGHAKLFPNDGAYRDLEVFGENVILAVNKLNNKVLVDFSGKQITEQNYKAILPSKYSPDIFRLVRGLKSDGAYALKYGVIIEPEYKTIVSPKIDGIETVNLDNSKFRVYNFEGAELAQNLNLKGPCMDWGYFNYEIKENKKYFGVISRNFRKILPPLYTQVIPAPIADLLIVKVDSLRESFYINKKGEVIIGPEYDRYGTKLLGPGDFIVSKKQDQYWLDITGKPLLKQAFLQAAPENPHGIIKDESSYEVLAVLEKDSLEKATYYLYNRQGNLIRATAYDSLMYFTKNSFLVQENGKQGMLDKNGELTIPIEYDFIHPLYSDSSCSGRKFTGLVQLISKTQGKGLADIDGTILKAPNRKTQNLQLIEDHYLWLVEDSILKVFEWLK